MDVHASPAVLPELEEFLASFPVRFRRPEGAHALERYLTGLRTELPNKNCDTMAQAVPGTSAQRLQACLTNRQWDHDDVNRQRVEQRIAAVTVGKGALILDETGCAKQGTASVGVARQYAGTLGQVGNCQVAVPCCDSDARASWSVAVRWSLPTAWAEDPARLQRARVLEDVTFQTTPQRALALREQARAWGVPHRCVVADADYGDHPHFLAGVEARRERYVVAIRSDFAVCLTRHGPPPSPARCPGAGGLAPAPVAHHPLATRDHGVVAQAVQGTAVLAPDAGTPGPHWLAAGGAGRPRAA
jgi:SRSO17 transposase